MACLSSLLFCCAEFLNPKKTTEIVVEDRKDMDVEMSVKYPVEIDMEMIPDMYMDIISCEFAYDPVRLPPEQDPTQLLYDRKTLQTIWETEHHAKNPFTGQWFDIKSAIPQRELREEMKHFTELHRFPAETIISDYSRILGEEDMKRHLQELNMYVEATPITEKQWVKVWKKVNIIRLLCEYHFQNIKSVISLRGIVYFCNVYTKTVKENNAKEVAEDVGKEIVRTFDVIINGLRSHGENPNAIVGNIQEKFLIRALILAVLRIRRSNQGYIKIQSLLLRVFSTFIHEIAGDTNIVLEDGKTLKPVLAIYPFVLNILCGRKAEDIGSEDLNHGIAILTTARLSLSNFDPEYVRALVNAVTISISRECDRSTEISGLQERQRIENQIQARHNSEALEKGVRLIRDIALEKGGPLAASILREGIDIVKDLVHMFGRFIAAQDDDQENRTSLC